MNPAVRTCKRCNGTMHRDRLAEDVEFSCLMCGNVEYGDGFTPVSREDDPTFTRRPPMLGKMRL